MFFPLQFLGVHNIMYLGMGGESYTRGVRLILGTLKKLSGFRNAIIE